MGICHIMKRIVPIEKLKSKKVLGSIQDGSRGFISLLACICADGSFLPPGLIYQGTSGDLQDTWLEDYDSSSDEAFFACSEKGWTNDELGLSWLTKIFDPKTKPKAGNSKRLLLVDGHSSHINMRFVDYCDQNGIILAVLPPHSTHRLQPLDVGIFAPLARAYSNEIDRLIQSSQGFSNVSKRTFWMLFRPAWKTALTAANILSAFAATGIYPLKPEKVLTQLKKKTPSPPVSDSEPIRKTPGSVRGLRRIEKAMRTQGELAAEMDMIFRAGQKLATKVDLLEHENAGLREALIKEKGRRKRGKPMGLRGKDEPGQAVFFSPARIAAVRAEKEMLEAQKEQEQQAKELKKQEQASKREHKKQKLQNPREERAKMRAEKQQQKELAKMAREAQKQLNEQSRLEQQRQKDLQKPKKQPIKRKRGRNMPEELPEPKTRIARNGRSITLPTRFRA